QIQATVRAADTGTGSGGLLGGLFCGLLGGCTSGLPVPCTLQGNLGTASTARYQVTIEYFRVDNQGTATPIPCDPQRGTSGIPTYAVVRSAGTEQTTIRTLEGTYTFQTSKQSRCRGLYIPLLQFCLELPILDDIFGNQAWTISWVGSDGTSYVIVDLFGRCVSRTDSTGILLPVGGLGLKIETCNGSPEQTWTAPPAPFKDIREE
ncbi:MAG: hypothetical protein JWP76_3320, partial [Dactylosporangium sp.]|nr:hypothetical protein [Dactylosporangium sp.]